MQPSPPLPPAAAPAPAVGAEQSQHAPAWTPVDRRVSGQMNREDFKRVADARRELWTGGAIGGVAGLGGGYLAYHAYRALAAPAWLAPKHLTVFVLCAGAVGGYVGSAMRGMKAFERLGDVWDNYQTSSKYQQRVKEAQAAEAAALMRERPQGHR